MPLIFTRENFNAGGWAVPLKKLLNRGGYHEVLKPAVQPRRASPPWLHFVPPGVPGPYFWLAKPSILAIEDHLHVGLYVERGRAESADPAEKLTKQWRWNGFLKCLEPGPARERLATLLGDLPDERCIWIHVHGARAELLPSSRESLETLVERIQAADRNAWIDVVAGMRIPAARCIAEQDRIVLDLRNPLVRSGELHDLVEEQMR